MTGAPWIVETFSPEETESFGQRVGRILEAGDVLGLTGDLGSGKTCLVRGVCEGLGVRDRVTSPSFLTVNEYGGRLPVYHLDLYRIEKVEDSRAQGYDDIIYGPGVTLIEWSERIAGALPPGRMDIRIEVTGHAGRRLTCCPIGARGRSILEKAKGQV